MLFTVIQASSLSLRQPQIQPHGNLRFNGRLYCAVYRPFLCTFADFPAPFRSQCVFLSVLSITYGALACFKKTHHQAADHQGGGAPRGPAVLTRDSRVGPQIPTKHHGDFWPFQHLEMAVPVTELTPQQLGCFERGSAHTMELRSIHPQKGNRRRAMERKAQRPPRAPGRGKISTGRAPGGSRGADMPR